jgi:hypothetical protein
MPADIEAALSFTRFLSLVTASTIIGAGLFLAANTVAKLQW